MQALTAYCLLPGSLLSSNVSRDINVSSAGAASCNRAGLPFESRYLNLSRGGLEKPLYIHMRYGCDTHGSIYELYAPAPTLFRSYRPSNDTNPMTKGPRGSLLHGKR